MSHDRFAIHWAAVVLAAGSSSRMGHSKQLISIAGETLLQKTASAAVGAGAAKVIVVTGAHHDAVQRSLSLPGVELIHHQQWERGMGSSLKRGLRHVLDHFPEIEAIMFLVCDQPLLDAAHLRKMLETYEETKAPVVASFYSGRNGVPVLFHRSQFRLLSTIDDGQGAKKFIEQHPALVKSVDFPNGAVDLDTPEDLKEFQHRKPPIS